MNTKYVAGAILALLVIAGGSFYGGIAYAKGQGGANGRSGTYFAGGQFPGGGRMGMRGNGFSSGQIVAKDSTSITIQAQNGSTKIILLGSATQVMKSVTGSVSDLSVGTNVVVTGAGNQDGSITADTISIRPQMTASQTTPKTGQ